MNKNHRLQIFKDNAALSNYAANAFCELANQAIAQHGHFLAALSGGATPMGLYNLLGHQYKNKVNWKQTHFFWGDERCVPVDDAGNSYGQAKKIFLDKINISAENIHRILSELNPAEAAIDYAETLKKFSDRSIAWPRFDLALLGMGDDGHTASLFPGSPVHVDTPTIAVTANYQDRPANRVTLTQNVFNDAHNIFFLVTGKSKAEILLTVLNGEYQPELYPAQRINPQEGKVAWLVDEAAASLL